MINDIGKIVANRGVARNNKPLQNYVFEFKENADGTFFLFWNYEKAYNRGSGMNASYERHSQDWVKKWLTPNQWSKFRQGQRKFIVQRRVDGKNIPVK